MNDFIKGLIIGFVIGVIVTLFFTQIICNKPTAERPVEVKSNEILPTVEGKQEADTVVKWYERIIYRQSDPEVVYVQQLDTIRDKEFIESTRYLDAIIHGEKKGDEFTVIAMNHEGKVLKSYTFPVGRNFTVTSQRDNIFVKSSLFAWNRPELSLSVLNTAERTFKGDFNNLGYRATLETGINFINKIDLNAGVEYEKEFKLKLVGKYRF